MTKQQFIAAGAGLFIMGGALGVWVDQMSPNFALRQTAQEDVMKGYALFRQADGAMAKGQATSAQIWATQGMGSLQVSVTPLSRLSMSNANTVVPYLDQAQYCCTTEQPYSKERCWPRSASRWRVTGTYRRRRFGRRGIGSPRRSGPKAGKLRGFEHGVLGGIWERDP